jgi:hypothetical protein
MFWFVLILLVLAAMAGVLGAVLKVAFVLILSLVLAVVVIGAIGYYWVRGRVRSFSREMSAGGPSANGASPGHPDAYPAKGYRRPSSGGQDPAPPAQPGQLPG